VEGFNEKDELTPMDIDLEHSNETVTYTSKDWEKLKHKLRPKLDTKPIGRKRQHSSAGKSSIWAQIVGGSEASRGQFPWQVAIIIDDSTFCGGSLISPDWVMTAAHCAKK